ncbi:hypothetical protein EW146_g6988 [Bondarzewia mesenterica]|uniref:BZIP domain-containing protein n=1 Tax=Bondarzewia mesenterica TaxID=1095465 RepID=A0A4V3XED0_9AGAM|nr:hypothetical protein EW146_g6988 [Bondarzewia mesenterica]
MEGFDAVAPLWDFSQTPTSFSQLGDDDFLALLQKQFESDAGNDHTNPLNIPTIPHDGVDPSKLTRLPPPAPPPPLSDDSSSPSPPSVHSAQDSSSSRRQSGVYANSTAEAESEEHLLKRKASDDDLGEGPSHKSQHTASTRKGTSRRKSSGNPAQDETRLMKRKEQNRAAQRAFRERKEKHVKDLEDKLAELETKNEMSQTENEHLKELLRRLQEENLSLKQSQFTFAVPKPSTSSVESQSFKNVATTSFNLSSTPSSSVSKNQAGSPLSSFPPGTSSLETPSNFPSDIDFGSLTPFDINMLDDTQLPVDGSMNYDFGYGQSVPPTKTPYKTIASNPMFMSFAEPAPLDTNGLHNDKTLSETAAANGTSPFDLQAFNLWSGQSPPSENNHASQVGSLDELFGGSIFGTQAPVDFSVLMKSPSTSSISPVLHAHNRSPPSSSTSPASSANASSPSTREGESSSSSDCSPDVCPKTKQDLERRIEAAGNSMFAPPPGEPSFPAIRKGSQGDRPMVMCKGATFPATEKSEKNVEVLSAWRSITSHPHFKSSNIDINELCAEFTDKARCDGTKVVLDPQGVNQILEKLAAKLSP